MTGEELAFAVFCIESMSDRFALPADKVYDMLTKDTDVLYQYIIPCYGSLHTQSKEYILNDIYKILKERGVKFDSK